MQGPGALQVPRRATELSPAGRKNLVHFYKYEGLGNDFVVVEAARSALTHAEIIAICDRHRGVGADGVLFTGVEKGRPFMHVVNADGSVPQMCGNGLRCVALHLTRRGLVSSDEFEVDTDAGPHACVVHDSGALGSVEVSMAVPDFAPSAVRLSADSAWIDAAIPVLERTLHVTAVSMGNPHAVVFDEVGEARAALGPALQSDPRFTEGVNVSFARLSGPHTIELHVLERGAGWTQACGTGACATVAAAVRTERVRADSEVRVLLPGGELSIRAGTSDGRVRMRGPARWVFEGDLSREVFAR